MGLGRVDWRAHLQLDGIESRISGRLDDPYLCERVRSPVGGPDSVLRTKVEASERCQRAIPGLWLVEGLVQAIHLPRHTTLDLMMDSHAALYFSPLSVSPPLSFPQTSAFPAPCGICKAKGSSLTTSAKTSHQTLSVPPPSAHIPAWRPNAISATSMRTSEVSPLIGVRVVRNRCIR